MPWHDDKVSITFLITLQEARDYRDYSLSLEKPAKLNGSFTKTPKGNVAEKLNFLVRFTTHDSNSCVCVLYLLFLFLASKAMRTTQSKFGAQLTFANVVCSAANDGMIQ